MAGWSSRLTLDFPARSCLWEYSLYPFVRRRKGSLEEFDRLSLMEEERKTPGGGGGKYYVPLLRLTRKDGAPVTGANPTLKGASPIIALWPPHSGSLSELRSMGERLARKAGLPFREEAGK